MAGRPRDGGRIVVLGGRGMLGQALGRRLAADGRDGWLPTRDELDLTRPERIQPVLAEAGAWGVINAAAFSDVVRAETDACQDELFQVNAEGPGVLARACRQLGIRLIHVSTDFVFDGRATTPYGEDAVPAPVQAYGRSKLAGEQAVLAGCPEACVARTSTLWGPGPRPRPHFVDSVLDRARRAGQVDVVATQVSSPTYTPDLAGWLLELLALDTSGIVNAVNRGRASRLELARRAVELAGIAATVAERRDPPDAICRPAFSVLDTTLLERLLGQRPRPWSAALAEYLGVGSAGGVDGLAGE